mmetsp:Transcript_7854/g.15159  ORF Transcript_7854/g.15159 Transcript_7854/m.15159 type:complete len:90 (-) Transcript_7854:685-954(-)
MGFDTPISAALRNLARLYTLIQERNMGMQVSRALYFSRLSGPSRTACKTVENALLTNPDQYQAFRMMVCSLCLNGNSDLADIVVDYYLN